MRVWVIGFIWFFGFGVAWAQDETAPALGGALEQSVTARVEALKAALPDRRLEQMREAPSRFVEDMADLIYGHGTAGALRAGDIERIVAIRRAAVRGREMRRFLLADLDDDGAVTAAEIATLVDTAAATRRGALVVAFRQADQDGDGRIDLSDMRIHAAQVARQEWSAQDERDLMALLVLDEDGDGAVSLDEVVLWTEAFSGSI